MSSKTAEGRNRYALLCTSSAGMTKTLRAPTLTGLVVLFAVTGYFTFLQKEKPPAASSYPNFRVEFFDEHSGVIIGPRVFHTKDSGRTWSIIDYVHPSDSFKAKDGPKPAKHLVHFVDPEWAWRVSPIDSESVEYTSDGGRSWSEPIRTGVKARSSLLFVSRETGWVFGEVPVITRDGGKTWREETALSNLRLDYPYFLDRDHGWVANYWGIIGHTKDGGQHWSILRTPLKQVRSLFFLNPEHGWAVGEDGLVASTENGGLDWKIRDAQVPFDSYRQVRTELLDIFFLTSDLGWIVGERGLILVTKDGGKNWFRAATSTSAPLSSVRFTDPQHGWAVGGESAGPMAVRPPSNVVLETNDGGRNWTARTF